MSKKDKGRIGGPFVPLLIINDRLSRVAATLSQRPNALRGA